MGNDTPHIHKKSNTALLIIDMINDLEFPGGEDLLPYASKAADRINDLKNRANDLDIPVIYVNDNYGKWQSDFREIYESCADESKRGSDVTKKMKPLDEDYFVLKPQFSAFYATPLELLLNHLETKTLIMTGVSGDKCIHFSANDAYMRSYNLYIPSDCMASDEEENNKLTLELMENVNGADTTPSNELSLEEISHR